MKKKGNLRAVVKVVTSARLVDILDKNGNGKIEWKEVKNAKFSDWIQIAGELGLTALAVFGVVK